MPRGTSNTGKASAGRAQLAASKPAGRTARTRTTTRRSQTDSADTVDRKAAKRGNFEPRSALDPTIDASAGDRAQQQQAELA